VLRTLVIACVSHVKCIYIYRDVFLIPGDSNKSVLKYLVNQFSMNFTSDVSVYTAFGTEINCTMLWDYVERNLICGNCTS
jgi:hypothetical protein